MVNLQLIADYMQKYDLAAVVAMDPLNTTILKNFYSYIHLYTVDWANHPTIVAFPRGDEPFVVDFMSWNPPAEMRPAWIKEYYPGTQIGMCGLGKNLADLAEALKQRGAHKGAIGLDLQFLPVAAMETLQSFLPDANFVDATNLFLQIRAVKSEKEIGFIKKAIAIQEEALGEVIKSYREGATIQGLSRLFITEVVNRGGDFRWAINRGVATRWHDQPCPWPDPRFSDDYAITANAESEICFDTGVAYEGWITDMARGIYLGDPPPEVANRHKVLARAHEVMRTVIRPGMTARQLWVACHKALRAEFGDSYMSNFGRPGMPFCVIHCVGLFCHERPWVSLPEPAELHDDEVTFEVNSVFTIEPGCLEDMYVLAENGPVRLHTLPQELIVVPFRP
jgi:Xaa-Pro aminopeptidase